VDLLLEYGPDIIAIEIKAGATISSDWFGGLKTFADRLDTPPRRQALVYGGTSNQQRSDITAWCAWDVDRMLGEAETGTDLFPP
jgi:uncharacterized protein